MAMVTRGPSFWPPIWPSIKRQWGHVGPRNKHIGILDPLPENEKRMNRKWDLATKHFGSRTEVEPFKMREQSNCSGVEPGVINIPQLIRGSWQGPEPISSDVFRGLLATGPWSPMGATCSCPPPKKKEHSHETDELQPMILDDTFPFWRANMIKYVQLAPVTFCSADQVSCCRKIVQPHVKQKNHRSFFG